MREPGTGGDGQARLTPRLIESLYTEAMLLADEARSYFDHHGRDERALLDPFARVGFACESLKITTRIMHIIAWLLSHRAISSGGVEPGARARSGIRLGAAAPSDAELCAQLPPTAQRLIAASADLYARIQRIDQAGLASQPPPSPARVLMGRLERDLIGRPLHA